MDNPKEEKGFVYIFRHDSVHNEIKVGLSKHPFKRLSQLYTTATARPMNVSMIWCVSDMRKAERIAHDGLARHRINRRREFFHIAPPGDFSEGERLCYETTSIYLQELIALIEEAWVDAEINFMGMNVQVMHDAYIRGEDISP